MGRRRGAVGDWLFHWIFEAVILQSNVRSLDVETLVMLKTAKGLWVKRVSKTDFRVLRLERCQSKITSFWAHLNFKNGPKRWKNQHVKTIAEPSFNRLSWSSIQNILSEDLNMRRIARKFVPRLLSDQQRKCRFYASLELRNQLSEEPNCFHKVIINQGAIGRTM